jgi:hypothetical protein
MEARGVAKMTSKISSEEDEDDANLWQKKPPAVRKSCGGSSEIAELSWRR